MQTLSGEIERLAEDVGRSVVSVGGHRRGGTGIVWDEHTIVTAHHIVRGLEEAAIGTHDGKKTTAKVAGRMSRSDIAVLKVQEQLSPIQRGDSGSLRAGQFVLALANPFSSPTASVTSGIITSVNRNISGWWGMTIENAIVSDARVNPGYSGGPLVDASGRLVGMNVAYFSSRDIAVPVDAIAKAVSRLESGQPLNRAYLGIASRTVELPEDIASDSRIGQDSGVMVLSVEGGTPAKSADLRFGDVILKFDDQKVSDQEDLSLLLSEEAIGKERKVTVLRGGSVVEVHITPTAGREE